MTTLLSKTKAFGIYSLTQNKWIQKYNIDNIIYPASITKLITAIITLNTLKVNKYITINSQPQVPKYRADLIIGSKYTADFLLNALLISSMNDVAVILCDEIEKKTNSRWINLTKNVCKKYGMQRSQFINPTGLHNKTHYTTVRDLITLGINIYNNDIIMNILKKPKLKIIYNKSRKPKYYKNLNTKLNKNGVIAGKTGYTPKAGKCFLFYFEKNNHIYNAVFVGAKKYEFEKVIDLIIDSV